MTHCPPIITRFPSLRQTQGERAWLSSWSELIARPIVADRKQDLSGWSPATFEGDSRADGHAALSLSALVIEHDDGTKLQDFDDLWQVFERIIYTTWSHTDTWQRFRCILPLTRPITVAEHAVLWRWAEARGIQRDQYIDPQTKDAKRFWFVPGCPRDGTVFSLSRHGAVVDPDEVIASENERQYDRRAALKKAVEVSSPKDVLLRARAYLAKVPGAVSGQGGHTVTWRTAVALVRGFALSEDVAIQLLREWNVKCDPPWSEKELAHKIRQASARAKVEYGYLLGRSR